MGGAPLRLLRRPARLLVLWLLHWLRRGLVDLLLLLRRSIGVVTLISVVDGVGLDVGRIGGRISCYLGVRLLVQLFEPVRVRGIPSFPERSSGASFEELHCPCRRGHG